jgi:hypothetical protein
MKKQFDVVRQALEEHLSSINENTSEIQALFDYLHELDTKIDKLSQRIDQTQLEQEIPEKPNVDPLNQIERKVFLVLYTENSPLSYDEIALKARLPCPSTTECVSSLTSKGVPLLRSSVNGRLFFKLSPSFKEIQAKENLINLSLQSFIQ